MIILGYNKLMKDILSRILQISLSLFLLFMGTACNAEVSTPVSTVTFTPTQVVIITATLPLTLTPYPSATVPALPVIGTTPQISDSAPIAGASPTIALESVPIPSATPTLILAAALQDEDSSQSPSVNTTLSTSSLPSFNHSSDISSPEGDLDDWVRFSLGGQTGQETIVTVVLNCSGNSKLNLELIQNGVLLQGWGDIRCGQPHQLLLYLYVGAPYTLRLFPAQENINLNYIAYTLSVQLAK